MPASALVHFSPDSKLLVLSGYDGTVEAWKTSTWESYWKWSPFAPGFSNQFAFSPKTGLLVTCGSEEEQALVGEGDASKTAEHPMSLSGTAGPQFGVP